MSFLPDLAPMVRDNAGAIFLLGAFGALLLAFRLSHDRLAVLSTCSLAASWLLLIGGFLGAPGYPGAGERAIPAALKLTFGVAFAIVRLQVDPKRRKAGGILAAVLNFLGYCAVIFGA